MTLLIAVVVALVLIVALVALAVKVLWKVAEPNEAVVISGGHTQTSADPETPSYKIAVGKGALVIPGLQTARKLSLNARKADLLVTSVTSQGLPVSVRGVVIYKVGNTPREIANAASRFLGENEATMADTVDELFAGHMRSILGGMTMEEIINDRTRLSSETRSSSAEEMETLGLKIDSLQIQEIDDPSGYIKNLAKPHQAAVERDARIAEAAANQAATEKEQLANSAKAKATSESEIAQAQVRAQSETAKQEADQAGPLAAAKAQKQVVIEQTQVAKLEAERRQMELQTETVKPAEAARDAAIAEAEGEKQKTVLKAEAEATETTTIAIAKADARKVEADAEATAKRSIGNAEADAIKARLLAEAEGIEKRGAALAAHSDEVIAQSLAEKAPELVAAAAKSFEGIDNLVVLNGAEGMRSISGEALKLGLGIVPLVRDLLTTKGGRNGHEEPATQRAHEEQEQEQERERVPVS